MMMLEKSMTVTMMMMVMMMMILVVLVECMLTPAGLGNESL